MKKLLNDPANYVDESLDGLCAAFEGYRRTGRGGRVIARRDAPVRDRVGVVTGGGFGHLPVFAGYVAPGMVDACAVGNVFAGPPADICADSRLRSIPSPPTSHPAKHAVPMRDAYPSEAGLPAASTLGTARQRIRRL